MEYGSNDSGFHGCVAIKFVVNDNVFCVYQLQILCISKIDWNADIFSGANCLGTTFVLENSTYAN